MSVALFMFGYSHHITIKVSSVLIVDLVTFLRLQSQHSHCSLGYGLKSFLLEQSYRRQNLSTAPHREDCESFVRAMCSGSQVRALGASLSKHTLMHTHPDRKSVV